MLFRHLLIRLHMNNRADWVAWSMQFIAGIVVGSLLGISMISDRRGILGDGWWDSPVIGAMFVVGVSLTMAGLASFYGDSLWLGSSHQSYVTGESPRHSDRSRRVSIISGALGVLVLAIAIVLRFTSEA
jgi:hypothetical protein